MFNNKIIKLVLNQIIVFGMQLNNCNFQIVKGFISNKKLNLTNLQFTYGSTYEEDNNSNIDCFTLDEIQKKYNIKFNVLVADCEGYLEEFFDQNPELYNNLRLVILEEDYKEKCNYNKIYDELKIIILSVLYA